MKKKPTFVGDTPNDRKLWHTYLYWARERVRSMSQPDVPEAAALVDDPNRRVEASTGKALQAIIFSAFALEYRLKRVLVCMGASFPEKETLKPLLVKFWERLKLIDRWDKSGKCTSPSGWKVIEPVLLRLVELRNDLAHANYKETLQFLSGAANPEQAALQLYNAVIDAIKLVNQGTGIDTTPPEELDRYFEHLKVKPARPV